jgi:hypothetical protein
VNIALYSRTPLAAAPWELYRALKKYTNHNVSLINETNKYNDGRAFPHHLIFSTNNGVALRALMEADVWHVHNYLSPRITTLKGKSKAKVLAQFHSVPRLGNWQSLMRFANMSYTIDQPLQLKEYKMPGLPNIIDPDEYRPIQRSDKIKIAFAPSTRTRPGRPDSKGYHEVRRILDQVALKRDVNIAWIEGKEYYENLQMKKESHILIDDVVTGNWHRTSLEGLCFGCAVLNRISKLPFVFSNLGNLEEKLLWLIDNPGCLEDIQDRSRLWILQNWHPIEKIEKYLQAYGRLNAR